MGKKKSLIVSVCKWALPMLGFAACKPIAAEYGVPTMDFEVSGTVMDEEKNPIKGIEVKADYDFNKPDTFTGADGTFSRKSQTYPMNGKIDLIFTDVDGPENGEFKTDTVRVTLNKVKNGDGKWNEGTYTGSNINVTLKKKENKD